MEEGKEEKKKGGSTNSDISFYASSKGEGHRILLKTHNSFYGKIKSITFTQKPISKFQYLFKIKYCLNLIIYIF